MYIYVMYMRQKEKCEENLRKCVHVQKKKDVRVSLLTGSPLLFSESYCTSYKPNSLDLVHLRMLRKNVGTFFQFELRFIR